MTTLPDTRAISIVDIPLVWRLSETGTILDSEVGLTRDARGPHSAFLSSLLLSRGVYTLLARTDRHQVMGQFRYRPEDTLAHIIYLAPTLSQTDDTVWLHILEAMAREAGKHGAHALIAEVETTSFLFETLRTARFATYARQTIWHHAPFTRPLHASIALSEETSADQLGILSLLGCTIPTMIQQVMMPLSEMQGLVYRRNGRIEAYITYAEGKQGVYLVPYIHPDSLTGAGAIIQAALAHLQTRKVPSYVSIRSYQSWLDNTMQDLGFEAWAEQAIMVKHLTAGVRHAAFSRLAVYRQAKTVTTTCTPPTWSTQPMDE